MFGGSVLGFFRGLPLVGYVITGTVTLLLVSWVSIFFMGRNINSLHEQIGQDVATIKMLTNVANQNHDYARSLEVELFRCAKMRVNNDANSLEAAEDFIVESKEQYLASDSRRDSIDEAISEQDPVGCGNLPSRATELLIEATRSANSRDGDDS